MAATKLLNLLALSSLAILACSFGQTQVNALSSGSHVVARHAFRGHNSVAKRKRGSSKRCKSRPTSSAPPAQTPPAHKDDNNNDSDGGSAGSGFGHGGGGKFGLAWPNGPDPALSKFKSDKLGALYTWSPHLPANAKDMGINAIPMYWGEKQTDDFKRLVVKGYADTVLGFNEPNQQGQADMSPQRAAQLWKQYIQPLKSQGYKLISPATTSAPSGKTWMKDFFNACDGCTFDGIACHYYDVTAEGMIKYITDFHDTFKLPVWVTEYACQNFNGGAQCSRGETFGFHQQVSDFMDKTDWVAHYFPFGAMHDMQGVNQFNQLMAPGGGPTDLAYQYLN